jgi:hypothetical protein
MERPTRRHDSSSSSRTRIKATCHDSCAAMASGLPARARSLLRLLLLSMACLRNAAAGAEPTHTATTCSRRGRAIAAAATTMADRSPASAEGTAAGRPERKSLPHGGSHWRRHGTTHTRYAEQGMRRTEGTTMRSSGLKRRGRNARTARRCCRQ